MEPRCQFFDKCGGCQHQDVDYAAQIQQKEEFLSTLFHQEVSVRPNPNEYNYRNRMDFIVTPDKLGLKAKGTHKEIVDITRCEIQHESLNNILSVIRNWVQEHDIQGARPGEFEGFLRFVMIRGDEAHQQVTLTTTNTENEALVDELAQKLDVESLVWTTESKTTEASVGSTTHKVYGKPTITLSIADKQFLIDSRTFFQTSPEMATQAIQTMKEHVIGEDIVDLYCGVGVIGQCLSNTVVGVDNNEHNIQQARENAELNRVQATYECADAATYLSGKQPDTIVVDPPRTGLGPAVHTLLGANAKRIIYLSCNPKTQARDLAALKMFYEVTHLEGFDFFPHTQHIECLAILERKH